MNKKLGIASSYIVAAAVLIFGLSLLTGADNLAYLVCIFLSWGYVLMAASFAANAKNDKKAAVYGGLGFAVIYAVFVDLVYFTQITTVLQKSASEDVLNMLNYQSLGSLMFNLDLFGYGMMAVSTFLIGLTVTKETKSDKWMKYLMMGHGVFAVSSVALPVMNVFNQEMEGGDYIGTLALLVWCAVFIPIAVLSAIHFHRLPDIRD